MSDVTSINSHRKAPKPTDDQPSGSSAASRALAQLAREADTSYLPCLTPGLRVTTQTGLRAVEDLAPGDMVLTRDNCYRPVRWVGQRHITQGALDKILCPVRIRRDSFGVGSPIRDIFVAPRLRVSTFAGDEKAPLAPVGWLVGDPGIEQIDTDEAIYVVIAFDNREVIQVEGCWCEAHALFDQSEPGIETLLSVFPELGFDEDALMQRELRPSA